MQLSAEEMALVLVLERERERAPVSVVVLELASELALVFARAFPLLIRHHRREAQ